MIQNHELLQQVIATPDDDAPRLLYADWFEGHGEPERAELIRLQCACDKLPPGDPQLVAMRASEQQLLERFGHRWAEDLGSRISQWQFCRGFIERVECSLEVPAAEIVELMRLAPIRHIRDIGQFCDLGGVAAALPSLQQLTGLEFWALYACDDELLRQVLLSPHLANLRTLILQHDRNGNTVDEKVIIEALHSPHRARIEELAVNVDGTWRGPSCAILQALATSPHLRRLQKLCLSNAGDEGNQPMMDAATIRQLGASPNLAGLVELDLGQTSFPIEAWDEVLRWPFLSKLQWLRLHYARQVHPPSCMTVAEIADLPVYREAFNRLVPDIDWETDFVDPWCSERCWRGHSWANLRQQHLFAMWRYVKQGDYAGLEQAYRADCCRYRGEELAAAIDALPYRRYRYELTPVLRRAIEAGDKRSNSVSTFLRVRPDLNWAGEFHSSSESVTELFEPHDESSYSPEPIQEAPNAPPFAEAAELRRRCSATDLLDPNSAEHYLMAKMIGLTGRLVAAIPHRKPFFLSYMDVVLRM